ncbi:hypothetical protein FSF01_03460 [Listeria monocytogenes]|uniref:hypothetical protein n=1 Tax=Listeria monocytogenes TaxID=1639 RepID=UPI0008549464|nr:hypothetical protein [Listeria monocytogenes]EAC7757862.1 hypothetical protein [Listeria monocytogenes]EAC9890234.1 hypothetical protein [Listeria monocytogenes]EAD0694027.1 hypothetical protein [Listeria monocytogenes]EAE1300202.1 hypothetical protein [Listeria monocytogenes]EAE3693467.1 hypothetical protein [Listeria monocytogenes]
MLKIKKQAQSIYAFKETGGEVLNFQIEKDCLKLFSGEEILCEINDEIISKRYFKIKKVKLSDEKVCIFCHDGVYDYLLISYTGKNLKYTLGEGVADFLVLNDAAYVIYSEEGKFGSEENLPIAQLGLIKIDIFTGEITGLLDDCILETLIDVHTMSCNNKTIRILCYEENDNDFILDYDLTSKKVQNKVIINYTVDGLLSAGDSFYARYQNHIYQVNESMEITKEIIIDKKVYDEASSLSTGYSEVVLESENEFNIVQLSKL